jgi:4-amino-4-deoxy-L-arabinose transferase-like glycosyltransferase
MQHIERHRWIFFAAGLVALGVRLAPLLRSGSGWAMNNDSPRYLELAVGMRAGCGFARWIGHCASAEVLRTPGYPLFLALLPNVRMAVAVQGVIGAAVCLMVGLFVAASWGSAAGLTTELLLAFDAPSIVYGARIMSDILFQAMLAAAIVLQLTAVGRGVCDAKAVMAALTAALILGIAVLVRPVGIVLPLFAPLPLLLLPWGNWRARLGWSLLVLAIPALVAGGWMARNARITGIWTLTTDAAIDLYYFKAAGVIWYRTRTHETFPAVQEDLARALGRHFEDFTETPPTLEKTMTRRSLEIFIHDPVGTLLMTLRCLIWLAIVPDRGNLNDLLGTNAGAHSFLAATGQTRARIRELLNSSTLTALVALQVVMILLIWVGVAQALWAIRNFEARERQLVLVLFGVALVMIGLAAGAEAFARYRVPASPFLAIIAGIGWFGSPKHRWAICGQ